MTGQWRTRDLRWDNGRRGIQAPTRMGEIPEMGQWRRGDTKAPAEEKVITVERDRKIRKDTRKGHMWSGGY